MTQVGQADQRHHEHQERQHDRRIADHLFPVGPDDLAELCHHLLEVGEDERERVAGSRLVAGLLGGLDLTATAPLSPVSLSTASKVASGLCSAVVASRARRRERLPVGTLGASPRPRRQHFLELVAHRTLLRRFFGLADTSSVPPLQYSVEQGDRT